MPPTLLARHLERRLAQCKPDRREQRIAYYTARLTAMWPVLLTARMIAGHRAGHSQVEQVLDSLRLGQRDRGYAKHAYFDVFERPDQRIDKDDVADLGLHQSRPSRAPAGTPGFLGSDYFRSQWEQRTARALDRLGIPWTYEAEAFAYQDTSGRYHRYTPDFRIDNLTNTFIEVKGWTGADAFDDLKMRRVLKRYPKLTLMVWDADTIEYVEDCTDPIVVVTLLRTTQLAA